MIFFTKLKNQVTIDFIFPMSSFQYNIKLVASDSIFYNVILKKKKSIRLLFYKNKTNYVKLNF